MKSIYITHSPISTIMLDDTGELLQVFQKLDTELLDGLRMISEQGNLDIETDSKLVSTYLREQQIPCRINVENIHLKNWRLHRFETMFEKSGSVGSYEEYKEKVRHGAITEAKSAIRSRSGKRDELAAQIIHTIDELKKSLNSSSIRLSEMYSLHFPELVNNISNPVSLAKLIISNPQRTSMNRTILEEYRLPEEKIMNILNSVNDSLGGEMTDTDLKPIIDFAKTLIQLAIQLEDLENWIEEEMKNIAPNLAAVAGSNVSARLISQFASLEALAMKSASKIQMVGAEKALYSALKTRGGTPPKHGIIFQIPEIGNSPYWIRGKLARSYASKIAIAARLDYFKGEFLGDKYREDLRKLEKELREQFPKPPEKKATDFQKQKTKGPVNRKKQRRSRR